MKYTVEARCDHDIKAFTELDVPSWANYSTVDRDGRVFFWERKPFRNMDNRSWMPKEDDPDSLLKEMFNLNKLSLDDCYFPGWYDTLVDLEQIRLDTMPYYNRLVKWIKAIRMATGCSLSLAKWAVDCSKISGREGTHEDMLDSIRFILEAQKAGVLSLDDNSSTARLAEARDTLKNGIRVNPLVQFTLDYWEGDNE